MSYHFEEHLSKKEAVAGCGEGHSCVLVGYAEARDMALRYNFARIHCFTHCVLSMKMLFDIG